MAWCQPGNKPLSEPMLTHLTDAYAALGGDEVMNDLCVGIYKWILNRHNGIEDFRISLMIIKYSYFIITFQKA